MYTGKYVFTQLTSFLPQRIFHKFVSKYEGNKNVKHFTCWNQLLCMIFGQLTNRNSLRYLATIINAHSPKSYHLGFGKSVSKSNLSKANNKRNSKIFEEFAYYLIDVAQEKLSTDDFEVKGKVYAFDSSTIDLCLSIFWWAKFRKNKGGIKLHTLYDVTTRIPVFIHITEAKTHDVNAMDEIPYQVGAYYVFDRAYVDFKRLFKITRLSSFFVIRAKSNLKFRRIYSNKVKKENDVKVDQIGKLTGLYSSKDYPEKIRRIKYYDKESKRAFIYLTNNTEITAEQVALLYKNRWQVELFFKWIKQHLKVKSFWGTSENAVRIQIYTAIITYCLVAIAGKELKFERSTYEILQILGVSLLDKSPVNELFKNTDYNNPKNIDCNQLNINLF
jgi:hypothetical protein